MLTLLDAIPFRDPVCAKSNITALAADLPPSLQAIFYSLISNSTDPDAALHYLESLHKQQPGAFHRIAASPSGLDVLAAVFAASRFLSDSILVHPEWVETLLATGDLHRLITADEYALRLEEAAGKGIPAALVLARFRRRELLRIVARDVMGLTTLAEVTLELSNLADAILDVTCRRIEQELTARYGAPRPEDSRSNPCSLAVYSLGKLGGRELNYSSDIDLMFVYSSNGQTDGPDRISNKEFFQKAATQLTDLLSTYTSEGMCYRVDLRLRPDGRLGEICISLDGAKTYYRERARDWELQMLIKSRVSAGDRVLGRELLEFVQPLIYSSTLDFSVVESASVTRERLAEKLASRRQQDGLNIKLARGGIRDIEFLVQCLQRLHGGREPWVRHGGTLLALFRLRDKNLLSPTEYSRLASAYQFLRHLEHRLQFADDRQTHTLPINDSDSLAALARKMPLTHVGAEPTPQLLLDTLHRHLAGVQEIYERVIYAQQPIYYTSSHTSLENAAHSPASPAARATAPEHSPPPGPPSNLVRSLDERAPELALALSRSGLRRGRTHFEHFLERIVSRPSSIDALNSDLALAEHIFDLFEHSPYFSEELIRTPELLDSLSDLRSKDSEPSYREILNGVSDAAELRRVFRREMFRLQFESICQRTPIFQTLERTSNLADAVIAAAYDIAISDVTQSNPPSAGYFPVNQMMVIALGRLGMREFDLASDADLNFVLPDEDAHEQLFWTRVAERMIALISAYTGQGTMFVVDTRLRPNGSAGQLVQTEAGYKSYFSERAEAWEGITYMKSRAVAGSIERATKFLNEIQRLDWRRYGQSGRSRKQLAQMRARLEKEQGSGNPLKAGRGGYYDIDFALMYLRLKGAGIFYKVLNTPARIDVIEQMGHLEPSDADFLRDAATFYRAVDHGLRVSTGQAGGNLPRNETQLEILSELVSRWTPMHLHDEPLDMELSHIQKRTREFFDRLFRH